MAGTLGGSVVAGKRVLQFVAMIYIGRMQNDETKKKRLRHKDSETFPRCSLPHKNPAVNPKLKISAHQSNHDSSQTQSSEGR